jgi:hypothetical protein
VRRVARRHALEHTGSTVVNRRWRLVHRITGLTKDQIAVGSRVLIEDEDAARVLRLKPTNA